MSIIIMQSVHSRRVQSSTNCHIYYIGIVIEYRYKQSTLGSVSGRGKGQGEEEEIEGASDHPIATHNKAVALKEQDYVLNSRVIEFFCSCFSFLGNSSLLYKLYL